MLNNYGTDHKLNFDFILRFLSSYNCEQRLTLVHGVEYECGLKLLNMVLEQTESPVRLCALAMMIEPMELYARDFQDLLRLKQTDKDSFNASSKLLEILLGFSNDDIEKFKTTYNSLFKISVERDLDTFQDKESNTSKLLIQLLEGKRCEVSGYTTDVARLIAKQLHEVDIGTSNIDCDSFIRLFTRDGFTQLSAIFDIYEDKYGKPIEELIEHEFQNSNESRCFRDIINYTRSPAGYYSKILREALDDTPIDYKTLIRVIIGHQGKDLCEIKLDYSKIYDETLDQSIEKRIDIPEIKHVLVMIITNGKKLASSVRERIQVDNFDKSNRNFLRISPITIGGASIQKSRSHEALDKLAHILKMKRLQ